jgi:hypothetical protein
MENNICTTAGNDKLSIQNTFGENVRNAFGEHFEVAAKEYGVPELILAGITR